MGGYKTWIAALIAICSGLAKIGTAATADVLDAQGIYEGIMMIVGGLALIGIGHKIEKTSNGG